MLALIAIFACTGDETPVDSGGDTDTGPDTGDTAQDTDQEPVWAQQRIETDSTINGIYASGAGVYAVGTGGFAFLGSSDDPWTYMSIDVNDQDLMDIWGTGQDEEAVLVAPTDVGLIATYQAGSWSTSSVGDASQLQGVGGSSADSLYAVGSNRAWHYDGATWTDEPLDGSPRLNDVWSDGEVAYAIGDAGDCQKRSGGEWKSCSTGHDTDLKAIDGTASDDLYAVGADGLALGFDGSTWTDLQSPTGQTLWGIFSPEKKVFVAVGGNGVALRWDHGDWEELPTGVDNILYTVHGVSASNLWAAGNRGMALHYKE